ncbi:unnamed protein product [Amoebophrya sp. A120]|nr:unnamed protein product [Amoebophrya sp. A120]|eukprot:GSA120T00021590001.1
MDSPLGPFPGVSATGTAPHEQQRHVDINTLDMLHPSQLSAARPPADTSSLSFGRNYITTSYAGGPTSSTIATGVTSPYANAIPQQHTGGVALAGDSTLTPCAARDPATFSTPTTTTVAQQKINLLSSASNFNLARSPTPCSASSAAMKFWVNNPSRASTANTRSCKGSSSTGCTTSAATSVMTSSTTSVSTGLPAASSQSVPEAPPARNYQQHNSLVVPAPPIPTPPGVQQLGRPLAQGLAIAEKFATLEDFLAHMWSDLDVQKRGTWMSFEDPQLVNSFLLAAYTRGIADEPFPHTPVLSPLLEQDIITDSCSTKTAGANNAQVESTTDGRAASASGPSQQSTLGTIFDGTEAHDVSATSASGNLQQGRRAGGRGGSGAPKCPLLENMVVHLYTVPDPHDGSATIQRGDAVALAPPSSLDAAAPFTTPLTAFVTQLTRERGTSTSLRTAAGGANFNSAAGQQVDIEDTAEFVSRMSSRVAKLSWSCEFLGSNFEEAVSHGLPDVLQSTNRRKLQWNHWHSVFSAQKPLYSWHRLERAVCKLIEQSWMHGCFAIDGRFNYGTSFRRSYPKRRPGRRAKKDRVQQTRQLQQDSNIPESHRSSALHSNLNSHEQHAPSPGFSPYQQSRSDQSQRYDSLPESNASTIRHYPQTPEDNNIPDRASSFYLSTSTSATTGAGGAQAHNNLGRFVDPLYFEGNASTTATSLPATSNVSSSFYSSPPPVVQHGPPVPTPPYFAARSRPLAGGTYNLEQHAQLQHLPQSVPSSRLSQQHTGFPYQNQELLNLQMQLQPGTRFPSQQPHPQHFNTAAAPQHSGIVQAPLVHHNYYQQTNLSNMVQKDNNSQQWVVGAASSFDTTVPSMMCKNYTDVKEQARPTICAQGVDFPQASPCVKPDTPDVKICENSTRREMKAAAARNSGHRLLEVFFNKDKTNADKNAEIQRPKLQFRTEGDNEDLVQMWKLHTKGAKFDHEKRLADMRLENLTWRLWYKARRHEQLTFLADPLPSLLPIRAGRPSSRGGGTYEQDLREETRIFEDPSSLSGIRTAKRNGRGRVRERDEFFANHQADIEVDSTGSVSVYNFGRSHSAEGRVFNLWRRKHKRRILRRLLQEDVEVERVAQQEEVNNTTAAAAGYSSGSGCSATSSSCEEMLSDVAKNTATWNGSAVVPVLSSCSTAGGLHAATVPKDEHDRGSGSADHHSTSRSGTATVSSPRLLRAPPAGRPNQNMGRDLAPDALFTGSSSPGGVLPAGLANQNMGRDLATDALFLRNAVDEGRADGDEEQESQEHSCARPVTAATARSTTKSNIITPTAQEPHGAESNSSCTRTTSSCTTTPEQQLQAPSSYRIHFKSALASSRRPSVTETDAIRTTGVMTSDESSLSLVRRRSTRGLLMQQFMSTVRGLTSSVGNANHEYHNCFQKGLAFVRDVDEDEQSGRPDEEEDHAVDFRRIPYEQDLANEDTVADEDHDQTESSLMQMNLGRRTKHVQNKKALAGRTSHAAGPSGEVDADSEDRRVVGVSPAHQHHLRKSCPLNAIIAVQDSTTSSASTSLEGIEIMDPAVSEDNTADARCWSTDGTPSPAAIARKSTKERSVVSAETIGTKTANDLVDGRRERTGDTTPRQHPENTTDDQKITVLRKNVFLSKNSNNVQESSCSTSGTTTTKACLEEWLCGSPCLVCGGNLKSGARVCVCGIPDHRYAWSSHLFSRNAAMATLPPSNCAAGEEVFVTDRQQHQQVGDHAAGLQDGNAHRLHENAQYDNQTDLDHVNTGRQRDAAGLPGSCTYHENSNEDGSVVEDDTRARSNIKLNLLDVACPEECSLWQWRISSATAAANNSPAATRRENQYWRKWFKLQQQLGGTPAGQTHFPDTPSVLYDATPSPSNSNSVNASFRPDEKRAQLNLSRLVQLLQVQQHRQQEHNHVVPSNSAAHSHTSGIIEVEPSRSTGSFR